MFHPCCQMSHVICLWSFSCTSFSQSSLFSLPLPFPAVLFFFCLMQKESNGQSNCCFSLVIHMEILISLLKESKTGQVRGGGCEHNTGGKEEEDESKMGSYLLVNTERFENNCYKFYYKMYTFSKNICFTHIVIVSFLYVLCLD